MFGNLILSIDLTPLKILPQLGHDLLGVLLVRRVDHRVRPAANNHAHAGLHRLQGITDRHFVDCEPVDGKLVRMVSWLRSHPVGHAMVGQQDNVDHVLHVCLTKTVHEIAQILVQTPETLLNLD